MITTRRKAALPLTHQAPTPTLARLRGREWERAWSPSQRNIKAVNSALERPYENEIRRPSRPVTHSRAGRTARPVYGKE